jgi:YVTN family beta-propeller protein
MRGAVACLVLAVSVVPGAEKDARAVAIAERMMDAMGGREAFESFPLLRFDWVIEQDGETLGRYSHWWDRATGRYRLDGTDREGRSFRVLFNIDDRQGRAWVDGTRLEGAALQEQLARAYGRFINDSYWLLMPWKWLDDGVNLAYEGERTIHGDLYDVVALTFDSGVGLTSGDRYRAFVSRKTGLMDRWEYVLQDAEGNPGAGEPTAWEWSDWRRDPAGILFATRRTQIGVEHPMVITFPVAHVSREATASMMNPVLRPPSSTAPPGENTGTAPAEAGVHELLIALNKTDHTAALVDVTTMDVLRLIPTGVAPHEAAVSRDGRTLYVSNYGDTTPGHTLTVIDLPSGTVTRTVELGEHTRPHGLAVGPDGSLWVTAEGSGSVLRLDPRSLEVVRAYPTGQEITHMLALSRDGSRVFTANIGSGSVSRIDVTTGQVATVPTGPGAEGIALSPDGREVWAASREADEIVILDARSLKERGRVRTCSFPVRVEMMPRADWVLVSCAHSNQLLVLDRPVRKALALIDLESMPIGIQVNPEETQAFVANSQSDNIWLVDLLNLRVIGSFGTGREPDGLAWAVWDPEAVD